MQWELQGKDIFNYTFKRFGFFLWWNIHNANTSENELSPRPACSPLKPSPELANPPTAWKYTYTCEEKQTLSVPKWQNCQLRARSLFLWSVWSYPVPLGWSVTPCSCCLADNFLLSDEIIANGFHSCDSDEEDRASHASSSDWTPRPRIGKSLEQVLGCSLPLSSHFILPSIPVIFPVAKILAISASEQLRGVGCVLCVI